MRRWLLSGLPLIVALAVLSLAGVVASAYLTYRQVFTLLNDALDNRILLAAKEGALAAEVTASKTPGGLWDEDEGRRLHAQLAMLRRTSQLENLFIFDRDMRALADARPVIKPGKQYTLFHLSATAVQRVLEGQAHVDRKLAVGSLSFRNATVPVYVGGKVIGGAYAQADIDFEKQLHQLSRNWRVAGFISILVGAVFLTALIGVHHYMNRIREALNRRSRLGLISLLSAGISHDIKNPLGAIMASCDLLRRHVGGSEDAGELVGYIKEGADRILDITQNLLSGGDVSERRAIPLQGLVSALLKQLQPVAMEKNVMLTADCGEVLTAWGSPFALRMALANIVKNALEAVPRNEGSIQITFRRDVHRIGIAVSDNGPGIDASLRKKIFDPLVTTKSTGSGLGLPVTRQILEDMHGSLVLETEPGIGSTFVLWVAAAPD